MVKIPVNLRGNIELRSLKDSILASLNQNAFALLPANQQESYLTKDLEHFNRKVSQCEDQEQRDRIINRCTSDASTKAYDSSMNPNPLIKSTIG